MLPNLRAIAQRGAFAALNSTVPPMTPPAWSSLMTGKNPGKHGIFDFLEMSTEGTSRPVAARRAALTIWEALSLAGHRVGTFNVPTTFPPAPLSAFQFSGFDAPSFGPELATPERAYSVVVDEVGEYDLSPTRLHQPEIAEDALAFHTEMPARATRVLLEAFDCEVYMVSFQAVDWAQHSALGPDTAAGEGGMPCAEGRVVRTYRNVDAHVGALVEDYADEQTIVAVASDHGARPVDRLVNLEMLFLEHGLMAYTASEESGGADGLEARRSRARSALNLWMGIKERAPWLAGMLAPLARRMRGRVAGYQKDMAVDWSRTRAVPWGAYGQIRLNVEGREAAGSVRPSEMNAVGREVTELLLSLRDPEDGTQIYAEVLPSAEIYRGPHAGDGADLVAIPRDPRYFAVSARLRKGAMPLLDVQPTPVAVLSPPWGVHSTTGVLLVAAPNVQAGVELPPREMYDVTPTLLYLLGEPVPEDMDGSVAVEAIAPAHLESHPVRTCEPWPTPEETGRESGYTEDEEEKVEERLRALGYL